jgi:transcriptional regulator with XRE-family HTH domain
MMDITELGGRIKRMRKARSMTLKQVEALSHVSATHISEIERGKTSPTINALSRISGALGKDTSFFLETRSLENVSRICFEDREKKKFRSTEGYYQPLTAGIPGGHLQIFRIHLEPSSVLEFEDTMSSGEVTLICERGQFRFDGTEDSHELEEGDSVHFTGALGVRIESGSRRDCDLILVSTQRHSLENF